MEHRRALKISKLFDYIVDEKRYTVQSLDSLVNQIFHYIGNHGGISISDKIYQTQLKLLQLLAQFDQELEALRGQLPSSSPEIENIYTTSLQIAPTWPEIPLNDAPTHDTELSSSDLQQNIRATMRDVSEKLGLSEKHISSMTEYYAKPSKSTNAEITVGPTASSSRYAQDLENYEIPEKDVNEGTNSHASKIDICEIEPTNTNKHEPIQNICSSNLNPHILTNLPTNQTFDVEPTLLSKLNNLKKTENNVMDIKPLQLPDLTLQVSNISELATKPQKDILNVPIKNTNKTNNLFESSIIDLKRKTLPEVGDACLFSHIETPSNFYIHIIDEESSLIDKISDDIHKYMQTKSVLYKSVEEAKNYIHNYGVVYIDNSKTWYRMEVLNWQHDEKNKKVLVRLVDYGSTHSVCYKNLQRVPENVANIPILAVQCHFPLMYPPESTPINLLRQWPEETIVSFTQLSGLLTESDSPQYSFILDYVSWDSNLNSLAVDLHEMNHSEEHTIGQILLDLGLAVQITEEYDEESADLGVFLQDIDSIEYDNINEAITGYDARDEVRICRFTKPDGTCAKGRHCKLEHKPFSKEDSEENGE